ncbi:MAG: MBL fold metallo-hydrolase [Candidatus Thorarchaeota archaeon]
MSKVQDRLVEITDQIFLIQGENNGRFPFAHSLLITGDETALIDTGCGIDLLKDLQTQFDIDYVINSHTHIDHSAGNWIFQDRRIFVPQEAFSSSGDLVALSTRFVGDVLAPIWRQFAQSQLRFQDCRPTHSYNEATSFRIGEVELTPIYTPGHTLDHYVFYFQSKRILFSFDYDLTSFPWYGHQESSLLRFRQSINQLKKLPTKIVVSSHRGIIKSKIKSEWTKYSQQLDKRNQRIFDLLETPKTLEQLVASKPIYHKFPYQPLLLQYWEKIMIQLHLDELQEANEILQHGGKYHQQKK